nr:hypothetical protein [uncultured Actinoplanes sp.]
MNVDPTAGPRWATVDDGREPRYAHSYIGLGITPTVALELEAGGKGSIREVISTIRTFSRFRPFQIETDAGTESFDSVIFASPLVWLIIRSVPLY